MSDSIHGDPGVLATDLHVEATYRLTEALVASENRMRRRIELLNEIVFETDSSGNLVFLNHAWGRILGYTPDTCLGRPLDSYVFSEDRRAFLDTLRGATISPGAGRIQIRLVRADAGIAWAELSASRLDDGGIVGALRDVTAERSAQHEVARLSMVASCTDNLVIITDREGRTEWVNPAFVRRTGYRLEDLVGRKPGEVLQGPDTDPETVERVRFAVANGQSVQAELLNYTRAGEPYWVAFQISPIRDAWGRVERFVSVQTDSTELRRAQQDLKTAKEAAERMAVEAQAANLAKSEFLATMSHEIRTPMNGVLGLNELLLQTQLDPHQRELADGVARSGQSLLRIIDDILDFSKIEAGQIRLSEEPVDLRSITRDVISLLTRSDHGKPVTLHAEFEDAVPERLIGDPVRLRQVLLNLVDNGLKFTGAGSVVTRMRIVDADAHAVRLRCEVTDTGVGIPPEKISLLFQRFQQLDSSSSRQHGGTGLGLAITQRLVELMGGRLGVESLEGRGSTFWFEIRLPRVASPGTTPLEGLRVLLAHDHAIHRRLSLLALEKLGCRGEAVSSGGDALNRFQEDSFGAVIFDSQLPDMEASCLAAALRRVPANPDGKSHPRPRLIALVDGKQTEALRTLAAAGVDATLHQPFTLQELRQALLGSAS